MHINKLSFWQINLFLFFLTAVVVCVITFIILKPAFGIGFTPDDWELYLRYKSLGVAPLSKLGQVWAERGLYTTYQIYYMGLLDFLVGYNHRLFQTTNIIFKIIATLSLYPLILILFKRRILASLTTFLFAISYSSIGPLEFAVKGSDYVSIFWMSIFLMIYYYIVKKNLNFLWCILTLLILIISITFSPIRMFPLLMIPPLIEIYLLIRNRSRKQLKQTSARILLFYAPFILLVLRIPSILIGGPISVIYRRVVVEGNWNILLSPVAGLGYTFIPDQYWGLLFGLIRANNLNEYINFLIGGPLVIFGLFTILLAVLQSKNRIRFFLGIFITNFVLEIIIYFIAFNYRYLPISNINNFEPTTLSPVIFGLYILIITTALFIKWLKNGNKNLLLPLWSGLAFLIIFTFATWAFAPSGTNFFSTSYYLVVATIGSSLFLSAFVSALFDKVRYANNKILILFTVPLIVFFLVLIFFISNRQINTRLHELIVNGGGSEEQIAMQEKTRVILKDFNLSQPAFFYFDTTEVGSDGPFISKTLLLTFASWMHFKDRKLINGCLEAFSGNKTELAQLVQTINGQKGFAYRSLCVDKGGRGVYYQNVLYKPENFYAFYLKSRNLIDIKEEILKQVGF